MRSGQPQHRIILFFTFLTIGLTAFAVEKPRFHLNLNVNGLTTSGRTVHLPEKKPATLEFQLIDENSGKIYKNFRPLDSRLCHLWFVREDFTFSAMIHPSFEPKTGSFTARLGEIEFDNEAWNSSIALDRPGLLHVFGLVGNHAGPPIHFAFDILVSGLARVLPIREDLKSQDGTMVKFFNEYGNEENWGARFRVIFSSEKVGQKPNVSQVFHFELHEWDATKMDYVPAQTVVPLFKTGALAMLISRSGDQAAQKQVVSIYSRLNKKPVGTDFILPDASVLGPEIYGIWPFFRIGERSMAFPFFFYFNYI